MGRKAAELGVKGHKVRDPGIPNSWPFKEELLREHEQHKMHLAEERDRRRAEQKKARAKALAKSREQGGNSEASRLSAMMATASKRDADFVDVEEEEEPADLIGAGDRARASYVKELRQVVAASDVLLVVVDARDPEGCRCRAVERMITEADTRKRVILVLNKIGKHRRHTRQTWEPSVDEGRGHGDIEGMSRCRHAYPAPEELLKEPQHQESDYCRHRGLPKCWEKQCDQ